MQFFTGRLLSMEHPAVFNLANTTHRSLLICNLHKYVILPFMINVMHSAPSAHAFICFVQIFSFRQ